MNKLRKLFSLLLVLMLLCTTVGGLDNAKAALKATGNFDGIVPANDDAHTWRLGNNLKTASSADPSTHRAVLIGNTYPGTPHELPGPDNDVYAITKMLSTYTGSGYSVDSALNATASQIQQLISDTFADADSNDVSLFYYSGHGTAAGSLCGTNNTYISVSELRSCLDQIPGTKIVLLDCCYSGAHISKDAPAPSPSAFTNAVVSEFHSGSLTRDNAAADNYQILTACAKDETSFSRLSYRPDGSQFWFGVFTFAACLGSGYHMTKDESCAAYADANTDGIITLGEAYEDVVDTVENVLKTDQSTQYCGDSSFILWQKSPAETPAPGLH